MLFQINGLEISNLRKSSDDKLIEVDIVANHLTEDTDGEVILKDAFSQDTINEFLNIGVIDYWHDSKNPLLTKEERNSAIIGKPTGFRWENGKPVVTAQLTKSHKLVQDMMPHLEAGQPVYGASVGGSKMVLEVKDPNTGQKKRVIPKIKWDHLAIAPSNSVINRESGLNVKLLQKANDIMCEFSDINSFKENINILEKEEELRKALEAPSSAGDLYNTPGGVVTKQSIEKDPINLTFNEDESMMLLDTIIGIKERRIPTERTKYIEHFKSQKKNDFGDKSYRLIDKFFKSKKGAM